MSTPSYGLPAGGANAAPTCPRHPNVPAYVRCQTCNLPACGECQVAGPTGTRCVTCHTAANRSIPNARTRFGGIVREGKPLVTYILIAINVVAFGLQFALGDAFTVRWLLVPYYVPTEPWTLLTSAFLHSPGNPLHLILNMYVLYTIGPNLERWLGRLRFIGVYLLSAIGASATVYALAPLTGGELTGTLGASGAIFGLFAAFFIIERTFGTQARQVLVLVAINLAFGFFIAGISWQAHVGGLLTGGLLVASLAAVLPKRPAANLAAAQQSLRNIQIVHLAIFAGCAALIAIVVTTLG